MLPRGLRITALFIFGLVYSLGLFILAVWFPIHRPSPCSPCLEGYFCTGCPDTRPFSTTHWINFTLLIILSVVIVFAILIWRRRKQPRQNQVADFQPKP